MEVLFPLAEKAAPAGGNGRVTEHIVLRWNPAGSEGQRLARHDSDMVGSNLYSSRAYDQHRKR